MWLLKMKRVTYQIQSPSLDVQIRGSWDYQIALFSLCSLFWPLNFGRVKPPSALLETPLKLYNKTQLVARQGKQKGKKIKEGIIENITNDLNTETPHYFFASHRYKAVLYKRDQVEVHLPPVINRVGSCLKVFWKKIKSSKMGDVVSTILHTYHLYSKSHKFLNEFWILLKNFSCHHISKYIGITLFDFRVRLTRAPS